MRMDAKWTNTIIGIVVIAILAIMFPLILDGVDGILRVNDTDTEVGVTAAAGSGTVTLANPLYDGSVDFVTSVASSSGTDTPVASTYSTANNQLTITGLAWAGTRTITTVYRYDQTDGYTGLSELVEVAPMILWIGIIIGFGVIAVSGYRASRKS